MKHNILIVLARAALAVALIFSPAAAATPLKAETASAPGLTTIVTQIMGKFASRDYGIGIQVNTGNTLTKSTLTLAKGASDLTITPPVAFELMQKGEGPYKKLGEEAVELSKNLRGLFGFHVGWVHAIVWADSGIETFADLKGKRVFTGPPAGAANLEATTIIRAASGYEPGKDYEDIRLDWGAGVQAMQDGQFDVYIRPGPVGAAFIDQLTVQRKIRLLGLTPEDLETEVWKKHAAKPWYISSVIPANTYSGQINNGKDVIVGAHALQMSAHEKMDADVAYKLVKSFFDNADEAKSTVAILKNLDSNNPLVGVNIPLHPGALRYFREKGVSVPANLIPPEAQ